MALLERFERFLDDVIPPSEEVLLAVQRAEGLLRAGDTRGALRLAEGALESAPGHLRASLVRAEALRALGAPADALVVLDEAARGRAVPTRVLARMAELAARVGDEWRALSLEAHARARLRGGRDRVVAERLVDAARALLSRGAVASGLRMARGATLADPSLGDPWLLLGRDALGRGEPGLARRALERARPGLDATDGRSNRAAGELAWALGERSLAALYLRRAWLLGEDTAGALVAVLSQDPDRAALDRVLADLDTESAPLARALVAVGRGESDAREAFEGVPGNGLPDAVWGYALALALTAAPGVAERWARECPDRPGSDGVQALGAARLHLSRGEPQEALGAFTVALGVEATREAARRGLRAHLTEAWGGRLPALLEGLSALLGGASLETASRGLQGLRRGLDEPLRVVLLGEFSAGKSTILNALVGAEVSPMGVLPTTARVHWLRFGDPSARVITVRGAVLETTLTVAERSLGDPDGDPVDHVEVTLPLPRLGRLELLDTPGFNAGEPEHERAVRRSFELADVALWLFDARQAGRHSELEPLREARARGLPVFGVLNKIDQCPPEALPLVLRQLQEGFRGLCPVVAAVAAREALRDPGGAPGWSSLQALVDGHLVARREAWKQHRAAGRARALLGEVQADLEGRRAKDTARRAAAEALGERLGKLREALLGSARELRREVGLGLREQLRSLQEGGAPEALVSDAVAEVGWRARERALASLSEPLRETERLAATLGLVASGARPLATAAVVPWLDLAVAEGVRDAQLPAAQAARADALAHFAPGDPFGALETAAEEALEGPRDRSLEALEVALEVALEALGGYSPPEVPALPEEAPP
ncbi:MAG: dynamin family protein [Deltaproteobacteria bacterium]|nr:dynamin family protein [Deltaproteobacteria bacterium]